VCGFVSLALNGCIKMFFFAWEFPDLVTETWGGGSNQSSEFEVFKIRPMEI